MSVLGFLYAIRLDVCSYDMYLHDGEGQHVQQALAHRQQLLPDAGAVFVKFVKERVSWKR